MHGLSWVRTIRFSLLAIAGVIASPVMAEDEFPNEVAAREGAVALEPISQWNMDYAENKCRLARMFGTEEEQHLLFFEQYAPGAQFGMTLAGPELRRFRSAPAIEFGLARNEPMQSKEEFSKGEFETIGPAIIFSTFGISLPSDEAATSSASINLDEAETVDRVVLRRGGRILSFETGNMKAPFEALNTCTNDLLVSWGLDPEKHESYTPPKWENALAIAQRIQATYPEPARRAGEGGNFRARVIVEADGEVSDCLLSNSTQTRRLESDACDEMADAIFTPALDAEGNPMRSFFETAILYRMN